jgi:hypothetical protein
MKPCITRAAKRRLPITARENLSSAIGDVQLDMWYDHRLGWTGLGSTKGALVRHEGQG